MKLPGGRAVQLLCLLGLLTLSMGQSCGGGDGVAGVSAGAANDGDFDGVVDYLDNCSDVFNPAQLDTGPIAADVCVGATTGGEGHADTTFGTCQHDGTQCLSGADCARGNACDCDFDGNGACNVDDFNLFLVDHAAGVDTHGTDMNEDGAVDDLDFAIFEVLFAEGQSGSGAAHAQVIEPDAVTPGACYDRRQPRVLWRSQAASEESPNDPTKDILDCTVDPDTIPFLTPAQRDAILASRNNPTDAFVRATTFGLASCPNAAFSVGSKLAPRACDTHDLCIGSCGYAPDECNRQFYRDLLTTCAALEGAEAIACSIPCNAFATIYASAISVGAGGTPTPVTQAGPGPNFDELNPSDLAKCQCGTPVCREDADCLGFAIGSNAENPRCDRGYCVQTFRHPGSGCSQDANCSPGFRCASDGMCIWDVTSAPDRTGLPAPICGDGVCEAPVETCAAGSCPEDCRVAATPPEGFGGCGLGEACVNDLDCWEGGCFLGQCQQLPDGARCDEPSDCASDICDSTNFCVASCSADAECGTGVCGITGVCIPPQPNGSACDRSSDCAEGACNFGICTTAGTGFPGTPCTTPNVCSTGICTTGFCEGTCGDGICTLVPNGETCFAEGCQLDCGACPDATPGCDEDADCAGGLCGVGVCLSEGVLNPGAVCLVDRECKSGDCVAGLCRGSCGDGFCTLLPNPETCLGCSADCGTCPNGTPGCGSGSQCTSGLCVLGICVANCKPWTAACSSNGECCSGRCQGDIFGNKSCAL